MKRNHPYLVVKASAVLAVFTASASAQLTWSPDTNLLWDLTSTNWADSTVPPSIVWDNSGAQEAVFSDVLGASVEIADGGGTVGDLTTAGNLSLQSLNDNLGLITITGGGATWDTGGFEIEFLNNVIDTPLAIATGDILTITGGGIFDTGERPGTDNAANWSAAGATLDIIQPTVVRGNRRSVGQFDQVNLAGGSMYIHERNTNEVYLNNWNLGTGNVVFANRFNRNVNLDGIISGEGSLEALNFANNSLRLNNVANTFSGGLIINGTINRTEVLLQGPVTDGVPTGGDGILGAVPDEVDPDHIILREGGELTFLNMLTIDSNRGITIDGGAGGDRPGVIAISGSPLTYGGTITGTGGLQVGSAVGADANGLLLTSDTHDYTGGTRIFQGRLGLGVDEALPSDTVLTIGGNNVSLFVLNGFTQTLTGLTTESNNTRQIINHDAVFADAAPVTAGTVILDIADQADVDQEFFFGSAFGVDETTDAGNLNIVKNGEGAIGLGNVRVAGTVEVNTGTLQIGNSVGFSVVGEVINDGILIIDEATTADSLTGEAGSEVTFNWEVSDWTGAAGTGYTQLTILGDAALNEDSTLNIVVEEANLANFSESAASFQITVVGGTTTLTTDVNLDASGFTSGTGTWALRPDGENLFLDYTAGAGDGSYTSWAAGFPALTGGFNDDDDNDGVSNGLEFLFNGDPTLASDMGSGLAAESAVGSEDLVFTHNRPIDATDVTVIYEWSTTLNGDWTPSGVDNGGTVVTITPGAAVPAATGYEVVTVTASGAPAALGKLFVRVSLSMP